MRRLLASIAAPLVLAASAPAHAASGGPDGYGNYWLDSAEIGGPSYYWRSATTSLTSIATADEGSQAISLPFYVNWYGGTYSTVYASVHDRYGRRRLVQHVGYVAESRPDGALGGA
jgi:hypothetical protein